MAKPRWTWAVLVDEARAKLLHCGPSPNGRPHIDHIDAIQSSWEGHERGRPSPLKGRNNTTHAAGGHEKEEDRRRFANELVDWLQKQVNARGIESLVVFGPTRFLSDLRRACPDRLSSIITEQPSELINLPNPQLHQHPAIREIIGLPMDTARS